MILCFVTDYFSVTNASAKAIILQCIMVQIVSYIYSLLKDTQQCCTSLSQHNSNKTNLSICLDTEVNKNLIELYVGPFSTCTLVTVKTSTDKRQTFVKHSMRCTPQQCSSALLHTSFASTLPVSFLKTHACACIGQLHL